MVVQMLDHMLEHWKVYCTNEYVYAARTCILHTYTHKDHTEFEMIVYSYTML